MLELRGLKYISCPRPPNAKGVSYGGAAIVVNLQRFSLEKIKVNVPKNIEAVWGMLTPKNKSAKFKKIIVCSFYSPPNKKRNSKMADHIVSSLQMLSAKYPECGLILGADKNDMDIRPILNCGLRLRQAVDQFTRQGRILDIIIMNCLSYYNSPIIAPPIKPDNPCKGKPSDHSVPVCVPHTDRHHPPSRNFKTIKFRPLPASSVRKFGEWIVQEGWESVDDQLSPSEQVTAFETLYLDKLNQLCPEKQIRLSSQDKAFISAELKTIHRKKGREYVKHGKSDKYQKLASEFKRKYKIEAQKYLEKNVHELKESKPGQAYSTLKRMAAQPGDCTDSKTFTLPEHENESLTEEESAERIASHFALISQELPPLDEGCLPTRVQTKLKSAECPPIISDYEAYRKIREAKKPKTGVPNDLPKGNCTRIWPRVS